MYKDDMSFSMSVANKKETPLQTPKQTTLKFQGRACLSMDLVCCGNIWKETQKLLDPDKLSIVN